MWACPKCRRNFGNAGQPHSCRSVPLKQHFKNKDKAEELFYSLVKKINAKVGKTETISLPCCIHLFGEYDFLAALPKKDRLEIRFALDRVLDSSRLKQSVPVSSKNYKNCIDITTEDEINGELIGWISEAYFLKTNIPSLGTEK